MQLVLLDALIQIPVPSMILSTIQWTTLSMFPKIVVLWVPTQPSFQLVGLSPEESSGQIQKNRLEKVKEGNMFNTNSTQLHLIFFLLFISGAALITPAVATDHIVGANRGWNPSINYTLWANNQTFYVGDFISFRYQKNQYSVFEVNQTGYDNCTLDSAVGNWTSGKDFILLTEAKRYYFIGGNGQCYNGMKVSVVVHPLPSPPKAAPGAHNSSSDSAVTVVPQLGYRVMVVSLAILWFGFGWV